MAVGSGPEGVSAEAVERVRFDGTWNGTLFRDEEQAKVRLSEDKLLISDGAGGHFMYDFIPTDTGNGTVNVQLDGKHCEGRFRIEKERLILCFNSAAGKRPSSFNAEGKAWLLTLRRAKPGK
jgi:hypothetical protein